VGDPQGQLRLMLVVPHAFFYARGSPACRVRPCASVSALCEVFFGDSPPAVTARTRPPLPRGRVPRVAPLSELPRYKVLLVPGARAILRAPSAPAR